MADWPLLFGALMVTLRITFLAFALAVALGDTSFSTRRLIDAHIARSRLKLRTVVQSSSVETIKALARHGDALCFQFEAGTRPDCAPGELVNLPLADAALAGSRLVAGL